MGQAQTDRELALQGRGGRLLRSSAVQPTVVLTSTAGNVSLPSVTLILPADVPPGNIDRVVAALAWRKQVDSSGAANAINVAQQIQVRDDTPGTFRNAITVADNALATGPNATEGGFLLMGESDISVEVDGDDIYEFQWALADVDGNNLTLHDVQTYLLIEYT